MSLDDSLHQVIVYNDHVVIILRRGAARPVAIYKCSLVAKAPQLGGS